MRDIPAILRRTALTTNVVLPPAHYDLFSPGDQRARFTLAKAEVLCAGDEIEAVRPSLTPRHHTARHGQPPVIQAPLIGWG